MEGTDFVTENTFSNVPASSLSGEGSKLDFHLSFSDRVVQDAFRNGVKCGVGSVVVGILLGGGISFYRAALKRAKSKEE